MNPAYPGCFGKTAVKWIS